MLDLQNAEVFRAALESLQAAVCLVDGDRKVRFWNEGAENITGYLRQEVLGRFCAEFLVIKLQETKAAICQKYCPLVTAMRDGQVCESRAYLHHKSGYAVPVSLRAAPIRDAHGRVIGAVETFEERLWSPARQRPGSGLTVGHGLDALTQLPDYSFTVSYLQEHLAFAAEHTIPFGLVCIQLDNLEKLKVTHGRDAAEALLNVVAHTLRNGLYPEDFVGRWSEDQFLTIIASSGEEALMPTVERLRQLAESSEIIWWGDQLSAVVSVGGTIVLPGETLEALLARPGGTLTSVAADPSSSPVVLRAPIPKEKET